MMTRRRDYDVGYRRPPKHSQFKPGKSGNPRGRPKGMRNLATDVETELKQRVVVREGGNARRVSKQRGVVMALLNRALKGDPPAIRTLLELVLRVEGENAANVAEAALSDDEQKIIETYERRLLGQATEGGSPDAG